MWWTNCRLARIRTRFTSLIVMTSPVSVEPDWPCVQLMVRRAVADHGWSRRFPIRDQLRIQDDFWATGRLTLEVWLDDRAHQPNVRIHERTTIASAKGDGHGWVRRRAERRVAFEGSPNHPGDRLSAGYSVVLLRPKSSGTRSFHVGSARLKVGHCNRAMRMTSSFAVLLRR
jgi:hypothetical protein